MPVFRACFLYVDVQWDFALCYSGVRHIPITSIESLVEEETCRPSNRTGDRASLAINDKTGGMMEELQISNARVVDPLWRARGPCHLAFVIRIEVQQSQEISRDETKARQGDLHNSQVEQS